MKNRSARYIEGDVLRNVITNTPLISVDLIVKDRGKILLGKRVNKPAQGYWFTLGGMVLKNETISSAISRIAKTELGIELTSALKFIGVFEHLYDDGIFDHVSTHYVNIGYEVELSGLEALPKEQHDDYRWFGLEELLQSDEVHGYAKDYFTTQKGTVPQ
ncbi:MAG: GDP-mannose mannosyl hydrolase [Thiovulaceae bacterium]|nr:GDP-mannose mannosyl hydrolase [Sulfurimonadaceae bacterium]